MADKRIDAHTNTTTVANVDEFIVDSGANGTRNITYSDLKAQLLGTTSIATIGNSVTEAIYNVHMDQAVPKIDTTTGVMYLEGGSAFEGNIDSTPTAGSNNAVSSGGTKTYVDNAVSGLIKVVYFTGTTSANGNIQFTGLSKANTIVLGCQISGTADNACIVAIPYIYSALNSGNWGAHCLLESGTYAIAANMAIKGYVYYIEKQAYTN